MSELKWTTACPDWKKRILNSESLITSPPLFPEEAAAAWDVMKRLKIVDAPNSPAIESSYRQWLRDFTESIFGAYNPETGVRMITEFFLLISKKNSKSTTAAGIMLTALILNWRESAEYLILAPTIEVANNAFGPIKDMIDADDDLKAMLKVQEHTRTITHLHTKAKLKVVAADSNTVSGKKATGILVDELWLFGKKADAENMLREATGGLVSRPEGFVIYLTTQSDEPPQGIFQKKLNYARNVRDGQTPDNAFLPVLYEFPEEMIERDEHLLTQNFYITNPNLGLSVNNHFLERELKKAQDDGKESLKGFLAKHLNVEIGMNLRNDSWAGAEVWDQCAGSVPLLRMLEECDAITCGIDGGGLDDIYGLSFIGRSMETGKWLIWCHGWIHPIAMERRKKYASKYRDFENENKLTIVEEIGQDQYEIVEFILMIYDSGLLVEIGVDQHGLSSLIEALVAAGIPEDIIIGVPQGWKMQSAIKAVERRLAEKKIEHDGSNMMQWCVGNARTKPVGNAVMITKQESGTAKIDPLMALFDAASCMAQNPEGVGCPEIVNLEDV